MPDLKPPPGFDSESSFVLWEATIADQVPAIQEDGNRDYWRYFRLKRRAELADDELYRVAEHDTDPEIRKLAAEEIARRGSVITRALLGDAHPDG